jgi:hypothetical protein
MMEQLDLVVSMDVPKNQQGNLRVIDHVGLEHHLVQLAVLVQTVTLRDRKIHAPVRQKGFDPIDIIVSRENTFRQSHHTPKVPDGRDPVSKGGELSLLSKEYLVFEVL